MMDEAKAAMPTDEIMPAEEAVDTATVASLEQVEDNADEAVNTPAGIVGNEEVSSKVAVVFDVTGRKIREYSLEAHGLEFAVLAEQFAKKVGGIVR